MPLNRTLRQHHPPCSREPPEGSEKEDLVGGRALAGVLSSEVPPMRSLSRMRPHWFLLPPPPLRPFPPLQPFPPWQPSSKNTGILPPLSPPPSSSPLPPPPTHLIEQVQVLLVEPLHGQRLRVEEGQPEGLSAPQQHLQGGEEGGGGMVGEERGKKASPRGSPPLSSTCRGGAIWWKKVRRGVSLPLGSTCNKKGAIGFDSKKAAHGRRAGRPEDTLSGSRL